MILWSEVRMKIYFVESDILFFFVLVGVDWYALVTWSVAGRGSQTTEWRRIAIKKQKVKFLDPWRNYYIRNKHSLSFQFFFSGLNEHIVHIHCTYRWCFHPSSYLWWLTLRIFGSLFPEYTKFKPFRQIHSSISFIWL